MGCFTFTLADKPGKVLPYGGLGYIALPDGGFLASDGMRGYDGYGHFGSRDAFEVLAELNREHLTEEMVEPPADRNKYGGLYPFQKEDLAKEGKTPEEITRIEEDSRDKAYSRAQKRYAFEVARLNDYKNRVPDKEMCEKYGREYLREVGIDIFYGPLGQKLPFPLKVVSCTNVQYDDLPPSDSTQ